MMSAAYLVEVLTREKDGWNAASESGVLGPGGSILTCVTGESQNPCG